MYFIDLPQDFDLCKYDKNPEVFNPIWKFYKCIEKFKMKRGRCP